MYIGKSEIIGDFSSFKEFLGSIPRNDKPRTRTKWRIMIRRIFVHWNHPTSFSLHNWIILKCMLMTKYFLAKNIFLCCCVICYSINYLGSEATAWVNSVRFTSISSLIMARYFAFEQNVAIQCKILKSVFKLMSLARPLIGPRSFQLIDGERQLISIKLKTWLSAFHVQFHLSSFIFTC